MKSKWTRNSVLVWATSLLIVACGTAPSGNRAALDNPFYRAEPGKVVAGKVVDSPVRAGMRAKAREPEPAEVVKVGSGQDVVTAPEPDVELYRGSGSFISGRQAGLPGSGGVSEGNITLNFQGTDIAEVVKTMLGDILQANYALDERVTGTVYLQTSSPISREAVLPTLESLLQLHGAALVHSRNFYEIVPADRAAAGGLSPRLNLSPERGYQMLIVPLRYIAAQEMAKLLEPIKPAQGLIQADERRNVLTLAGTGAELNNLQDTIRIFDVDQLAGMSVGLYRLHEVEAQVLLGELEHIFGDEAEGPLAGLVRFFPIERLNAMMVITPQAKYLADAGAWIRRLDRAENVGGRSMFVYYVQNGRADRLADLLNQLFEGQQRSQPGQSGGPLPGARSTSSPSAEGDQSPGGTAGAGIAGPVAGLDLTSLEVGEIGVIADNENNALVIMASSTDYQKLQKVLEKLDVAPLQVLVEATIVEVALEDELRYGLQWYFKNSVGNYSGRGAVGSLPIPSPLTSDLAATASYEVFNAAGTRALLTALARDSKVNVVSSPSLMVLDNHTATIRVGDQVPVRTSETTNTSGNINVDPDTGVSALVTSTIQFKDTGVLLEVTPRVNAGGLVVLDISQEVNDVSKTSTSTIDSPTITQRKINTSVSVQSGETLVLGGLIRENKSVDSDGVPGLRHVPVLGWLFGSKGNSVNRTELVVLITPTAVSDQQEAREVTEEYRSKLKAIELPDTLTWRQG